MKDLKNRLVIIFIFLPSVLAILYFKFYNFINIFIFMLFLTLLIAFELVNLFKNKNILLSKYIIYFEIIIIYLFVFFYHKCIKVKNIENINYFLSFIFLLFFIIILLNSIKSIFYKDAHKGFMNFLISGFILIYSTFTPILIYYFYISFKTPFYYIIYFLLIVWISNSSAYISGMSFPKRHKVGLAVSPNKSYEGYVGALIFGTIFPFFIWKLFLNKWILLSDLQSVLIIFIINIFTMFGDLFESLIKRFCNSKDSSNLFKGHGGILDMVDSILFSFPLFYFLILIISK